MRDKFFVHKLLLLCLLALFITSCATPEKSVSVACKSILEAEITPTTFEGVERSEINEWILQRYPIDPDTIEEYPQYRVPRSKHVKYGWHYNNAQYSATFVNEALATLSVHPFQDLTGRDFTACLGEPDFYMAEVQAMHGPYLVLNLWYVDEGINIQQVFFPEIKPFQKYTPEITENTIFRDARVAYMINNDIEAMVSSFYNPLQESQMKPTIDRELEALQPWESWDAVQIINPYATE